MMRTILRRLRHAFLGHLRRRAIHLIHLPEHRLIYVPILKNACSSIKHALHEIQYRENFKDGQPGLANIHVFYWSRPNAYARVRSLRRLQGVSRFTVVRDPIERLISCYRHRVIECGDLKPSAAILRRRGLPEQPDLDTFAIKLAEYRHTNHIINRHSRPQAEFVGHTIDYFDAIFPIESMDKLNLFLGQYDTNVRIGRLNAGDNSNCWNHLSKEALNALANYYRQDYELLCEFYSPDSIIEKWESFHKHHRLQDSVSVE